MSTAARRPWWCRLLRAVAVVVVGLLALLTVVAGVYDLSTRRVVSPPPLDAHGHLVRTGDLTTHYEQWGTTGRPLVLVHGFLESSYAWSLAGPRLAAAGFTVYAIDVRGYGYTQRVGPYSLASDVRQLADFVAALHLRQPLLVGHSSGAAIVGDLARTSPESVAGVVFMDGDGTPYGVGPGWVHALLVDPYATALIRVGTRHPSLVRSVYRSACGPTCPPFDAAAWIRPMQVAGAEGALKAILRRPLIGMTYAQEREIHVPAEVLYGSNDPEMTAADAAATAHRLHTGAVRAIADAPHLGMLAAPQVTADDIAAFAATLPPA